jgi:ankyrin repeat protein
MNRTDQTREVIDTYFKDLERGELDAALRALSPDIEFELPEDRWNAVIPYLGRHVGVPAVRRAFEVRGETTKVLDYGLRDLRVEGDTGFAVIYTRAAHRRTGAEFEIEDSHLLVVDESGRIARWKVYFDPNGEIDAFNRDREQRLLAAVRAGDAGLAAELIGFGGRVDHRDPVSGLTLLMIAAGAGDFPMVRLLLDSGADVYAADGGGGATALHKACMGGSLEVVRALVEAGAFVDAVAATTGHTPVMDAVWFKQPHLAKYLVDQGAGLALSTHYGFSLQQHFDYELNVNEVGKEDLRLAEQHLDRRKAADAAAVAAQHLMAAVTAGDTVGTARLLSEGVAIDERFPIVNGFNDAHTPLLVASRDGHTEIVGLLLRAGADVNATEPTFGAVPLHKAVYNGHIESTRIIAQWPGVDLDFQGPTNGYTPLHDAIWHGYEECALILIEAGASLELLGHDNKTPLALSLQMFGPEHRVTRALQDRLAR